MNERIRELVKAAGGIGHNDDGEELTPILVGKDLTKFAELIVRECMNIARTVGNISEPDDWALDRCYEIEQRIQDRFGVEG